MEAQEHPTTITLLDARGRAYQPVEETITSMTFSSLAELYMNGVRNKVPALKRPDDIEQRLQTICRHIGNVPLEKLDFHAIEHYVQARYKEGKDRCKKRPGKLAYSTIKREVARIRSCMNWGAKHGHLEKSSIPDFPTKDLPESPPRNRTCTPIEYMKLLQYTADPTDQAYNPNLRAMIIIAYNTGMRRGEIVGLSWEQIDFKKNFIRLGAEDTKTSEGRSIPMNGPVRHCLEGMYGKKRKTQWVFEREGERLIDFPRRAWKHARWAIDAEDMHFHDLRHTFVTNNRGKYHDHVLMAITGHKTDATFRRYSHVTEADLQAAVA